ncbi:GNAT family N-acetyltransferase [Yoonia sp. SS1-5]|uniref:N-acetyltransferase family protein n=1 Tax=Yoonia rhodophyticola TaxID=3137370 RepID=A0AAN0MB90_9RHOB
MTDTTQTRIRPLRAEDKPYWRKLWTGYLTFYDSSVSDAVYERTFTRLLGDDDQDFHCLIATHREKPVGLAHFLFHRHCWRVENVCYLQDLYADPDMRGKGVGRQLIEAVYAAADAAGAPSVYWLTQDDNTTARTLYDRIGQATNFIKYLRPA